MGSLRKTMGMILCLFMSLILIACTMTGTPGATATTLSPQTAGADGTAAPAKTDVNQDVPDWRQPLAQTVTLTCAMGYTSPEDVAIAADTTPANSALNAVCKESLNIVLDWLWVVPAKQYDGKFAMAVASGALPDLLNINVNYFLDFVDKGLLTDLGPAFEAFALPEFREEYSYYEDEPLEMCTFDGQLFSLPCLTDNAAYQTHYYYRNDWLDDVSMDVPSNIEEVCDLAVAFASGNISGQDYTIGLMCSPTVFDGIGSSFSLDGMAQGYGVYPYTWLLQDDGSLVYGSIQPEMKTALDRIKKLYDDGGISREFVIHDSDWQGELIISGKVGSFYGGSWVPNWPLNMAMEADFDTDWKMIPIPSTQDGVYGKTCIDRNVIVFYNCLSKQAMAGADEAFVKILNVYYDISYLSSGLEASEDTYGVEMGQNDEDGTVTWVWNYAPIIVYQARALAINMEAVQNAWAAQNKELCITQYQKTLYDATQTWYAGEKKEGLGIAWGMWYSSVAKDGGVGLSYYTKDNGLFVYNQYYGPPTATQLDMESSLDDLEYEFWVNYVMGRDSDWDGFIAKWKSWGGDAWIQEVNAQYVKTYMK